MAATNGTTDADKRRTLPIASRGKASENGNKADGDSNGGIKEGAKEKADSKKRQRETSHNIIKEERKKSSKFARQQTEEEPDEEEWNEDQHKVFVASIYEIGLRNSSPAVILENMAQKPKTITSERVKSKLQKYRNNREKSKQEFMEEYDSFLQRAKAIETAGGTAVSGSASYPVSLLEMMGSSKLLGGDAAAFLTYAVMKERECTQNGQAEGTSLSTHLLRKGAMDYVENFGGAEVPFPELTEEEKKSSLGVSMTFVMGLFLSMTQHLMSERSKHERLGTATNVPHFTSEARQQGSGGDGADGGCLQQQMGGPKRSSKVAFSLDKSSLEYNQGQRYSQQLSSLPVIKSGEDTGEKEVNFSGSSEAQV